MPVTSVSRQQQAASHEIKAQISHHREQMIVPLCMLVISPMLMGLGVYLLDLGIKPLCGPYLVLGFVITTIGSAYTADSLQKTVTHGCKMHATQQLLKT